MENCIFCKIVEGEIPSYKLYEDDKVMAFLDIAPVNKGHSLIISKDHFTDIHETPEDVIADMMKIAKKISKGIKEGVGADGINIHMNNEKASGQVIFHAHIHVIPRHNDDGLANWPTKTYTEEERASTAKLITAAL